MLALFLINEAYEYVDQMNISDRPLEGKTVLEVGCGTGNTTRRLASLLVRQSDTKLIVTDISDQHFARIRRDIAEIGLEPEFVKTDATELTGVEPGSVDYLVCNYALCEISSQSGKGVLALQRFMKVLKSGGYLFVEEEFPINAASSPPQNVWALTWRILKSVIILVERRVPTAEYEPDVLSAISELIGFEDVNLESGSKRDSLDWLLPRMQMLDKRLAGLPNESLRSGFKAVMQEVRQRAEKIGHVEIPIYRIVARKP